MRQKSDIYEVVQDVITEASSEGHKLRKLRSDNAMEFKSVTMISILRNHHIKQELSTPYVPAENGRVECQNRRIIESARAMLKSSNLPKMLWAEAAVAACHIRNRIPLKRLEWKTPVELWSGSKPSVGHLRTWGSTGYTYVEECRRDKLDDKSERRIFVGYDEKSKSYRMWLPGTDIVKISRDVKFVESTPKRVASRNSRCLKAVGVSVVSAIRANLRRRQVRAAVPRRRCHCRLVFDQLRERVSQESWMRLYQERLVLLE